MTDLLLDLRGDGTKSSKAETKRKNTTIQRGHRRKKIPEMTINKLWINAGGRCQYDGCNIELFEHPITKRQYNQAYVAHIVAADPKGPRGHKQQSPLLETEYSNLMLLCDRCHREIDRNDVAGHPVARLTEMKNKHERRIKLVTGIMPNRQTHVILYGANIGTLHSPLSYGEAVNAVMPTMFPALSYAHELSIANCALRDDQKEYWDFQDRNLIKNFELHVRRIADTAQEPHFSVFALAPMPLLIRLGTLLPDLYSVDVFQRRREPQTWKWADCAADLNFQLEEPQEKDGIPALIISLSATVAPERIQSVLPGRTSIWHLKIDHPNNDCIKVKKHLEDFRKIARAAFDRIKAVHGQDAALHVFPAMPVSAAIEFGRVRMPKADLQLAIFDQNRTTNSFIHALSIQ